MSILEHVLIRFNLLCRTTRTWIQNPSALPCLEAVVACLILDFITELQLILVSKAQFSIHLLLLTTLDMPPIVGESGLGNVKLSFIFIPSSMCLPSFSHYKVPCLSSVLLILRRYFCAWAVVEFDVTAEEQAQESPIPLSC